MALTVPFKFSNRWCCMEWGGLPVPLLVLSEGIRDLIAGCQVSDLWNRSASLDSWRLPYWRSWVTRVAVTSSQPYISPHCICIWSPLRCFSSPVLLRVFPCSILLSHVPPIPHAKANSRVDLLTLATGNMEHREFVCLGKTLALVLMMPSLDRQWHHQAMKLSHSKDARKGGI